MPPNPAAQALPILYSFRRCPYAIRARLAIKAAGITVFLREVVLRDKPDALLAASPKGTVPVLQLPAASLSPGIAGFAFGLEAPFAGSDALLASQSSSPVGRSLTNPGSVPRQDQGERGKASLVIDQSLDIMRWALGVHDPHGWLCADEAYDAEAWITLNDGPFKHALDRYKYPARDADRPAHAWRGDAVAVLLAPMDQRLAHQRFLLRDTPSLADMAVVPFVRQFAGVDAAWFASAPLPHVQAWLQGITASPLFAAVMPKFAAWKPGVADTVF